MHPSRLRSIMSSVLYPAALIVAAPISAWAQTAPHLPDLSAYDCAVVSPDTTVETRHIGQVIKGGYNEWQEYYVLN